MVHGLITKIDTIDDLIYEFYCEFDSKFLSKQPQYRFLLLNSILKDLCEFNLCNDKIDDEWIAHRLELSNKTSFSTAHKIGNVIKNIIGKPTYFAASYWSPIDRKRHTISYSNPKRGPNNEIEFRKSALLFYLLTLKAPPVFHSAINYISTTAPRKDGLHSSYLEKEIHNNRLQNENNVTWWNIPKSIHNRILEVSGFSQALQKLGMYNDDVIRNSINIIMENTDQEAVDTEIIKYESIYWPIINNAANFLIPDDLASVSIEWEMYLNKFFYSYQDLLPSIDEMKGKITRVQAFFMACTHALYNKACPTNLFYTFPVRVSNTCCVFTLGMNSPLPLYKFLAVSHIVKSMYYHGLDKDYHALNALARNRIARGAAHKMRGPLDILNEFPYQLKNNLEKYLLLEQQPEAKKVFDQQVSSLRKAVENILMGIKSLENFIDIEHAQIFDLMEIIKQAVKTYDLNIRILQKIKINNSTNENLMVFGVPSHTQFVFEELISNSIRAFRFTHAQDDNAKLVIDITIKSDGEHDHWIVNVTDNGPGIPIGLKHKLFNSGVRGADSGGSGMGLFLIKIFLEEFGGDIRECAENNEGANFQLSFKSWGKNET